MASEFPISARASLSIFAGGQNGVGAEFDGEFVGFALLVEDDGSEVVHDNLAGVTTGHVFSNSSQMAGSPCLPRIVQRASNSAHFILCCSGYTEPRQGKRLHGLDKLHRLTWVGLHGYMRYTGFISQRRPTSCNLCNNATM